MTGPRIAAFSLTAALLAFVQVRMDPPGLLLERFWPGAGWAEAGALALYAAWLTGRVLDPRAARRLRPRVWLLFSGVFFAQLVLGLAGLDALLMTGKLHLPVPAMIVAGPIFRGGGLFMPILFAVSVLLVGPAWCSWLCYVGAWDDVAARQRKRPTPLPGWRRHLRVILLGVVVATAAALNRLGVPGTVAAALGGGFGILGVGVMVWASRRTGAMVHCTAYCSMGWLATRLGRLAPFRLRIDDTCTDCGACTTACRFDALSPEHVARRRPGEACTLCGDCVAACPKTRSIRYALLGLSPERARAVFLVMVVSAHAVFLGVARL